MRDPRTALMSIKPAYAERILRGSKRYELRRTPVKMQRNDLVVIYASSPTKAVVGSFRVAGVERDEPAVLWAYHGHEFGIDRAEYFAYFYGAETAHAIEVMRVVRAYEPVPLDVLRQRIPGFRPPQSYQWWDRPAAPLLTRPPEVA